MGHRSRARPSHSAVCGALLAALLVSAACAPQDADPGSTPSFDAGPATATASASPGPDAAEASEPRTAPADPTSSPEEPEERTVTIGATGDILPHAAVLASARQHAGEGPADFDFDPMFAPVADLLAEPDLALCHLETPLSPDNTGLTEQGRFTFTSPREVAGAVAGAGWDGCDFASNHTMDGGLGGLADTETLLRGAGLGYAGPSAREGRTGAAEVYDTPGAAVAHLAYTYTYPNDRSPTTVVPAEAPWLAAWLWPVAGAEGILEDARRARQDGADFVVVSMHWGDEYVTAPTQDQRRLARELLESEQVDLILGTHVHVVQPCEQIGGKYVFYGLGNFLSNQSPETAAGLRPETQEGMVARVELTRTDDGQVTSTASYQPTRVDLDGHVVRPAAPGSDTHRRVTDTLGSLGEGRCDIEPLS